mmetsp:Transcript_31698/g.67399  ORF Transcript_31698/g.67399 Transcript_31698/m.67399 type:complete len:187 (+) Transcript_31698:36-596(+)
MGQGRTRGGFANAGRGLVRGGGGMVQSTIDKRASAARSGYRGKGLDKASSGGREGGKPADDGYREAQHGGGAAPSQAARQSGGLPHGHTIVLVQYQQRLSSRTYTEHDDIAGAMDGLCQIYEQAIKMAAGKAVSTAKYTLEELWQFIDGLHDIGCLIYDAESLDYKPHSRSWIKQQVLDHLKGQVG